MKVKELINSLQELQRPNADVYIVGSDTSSLVEIIIVDSYEFGADYVVLGSENEMRKIYPKC